MDNMPKHKFGQRVKNPKINPIYFRLTDDELWKLEQIGIKSGVPAAIIARDIVLTEIRKIPDRPKRSVKNGQNGHKITKGEGDIFI